MQATTKITNRFILMTTHAVETKNAQCYKDTRKVAAIVSADTNGVSSTARLVTADKLLSKWGF